MSPGRMITTPLLATSQPSGAASLASSWTASSLNSPACACGGKTRRPILDGRIIEAHPQCHSLVQSVCRRLCIVNSLFDHPSQLLRVVIARAEPGFAATRRQFDLGDWSKSAARNENASGPRTCRAMLIISDLRANSAIGASLSASRTAARLRCGANSLISCRKAIQRPRGRATQLATRRARAKSGLQRPWSSSTRRWNFPQNDFGPLCRHRHDLLRRDLQHGSATHMPEAQLPRRQQCIHRILHLRARNEVSKKYLQLRLLDRDHAPQILREQCRQSLLYRQSHTLLHRLRRPAIEHIPNRSFARLVVHARNAQLRPQLAQRPVKRRKRHAPAQDFLHLLLRNRPLPRDQRKGIAGQRRIWGSRSRLRRQLG